MSLVGADQLFFKITPRYNINPWLNISLSPLSPSSQPMIIRVAIIFLFWVLPLHCFVIFQQDGYRHVIGMEKPAISFPALGFLEAIFGRKGVGIESCMRSFHPHTRPAAGPSTFSDIHPSSSEYLLASPMVLYWGTIF